MQQLESQQRACRAPRPHIKSASAVDSSYSFSRLVQAYYHCRRHKRNTHSALRFELNLERNLMDLDEDLRDGSYRPGTSICFAVTHPKPREVWAADFRDRIVHHLIYDYLAPIFLPRFIVDSFACIPGRGPLRAAERVQHYARSITQNWQQPAMYCKMDLANFFGSIDKDILWTKIACRVRERWWRELVRVVLFHDPRTDFQLCGNHADLERVPRHKRLTYAPDGCGLAIGNLVPSQFGANILLDCLDKFAKHRLQARYYVRYVDDFLLLHASAEWLMAARMAIEAFLSELRLTLNPRKTIVQPVARGIDFAGYVIKPFRLEVRRKTVSDALDRIERQPPANTVHTINSYLGLMRHASAHHDRARIANAARRRGHCVDAALTKAFSRG